ncbi:hypothetical protein BH24DEI2_BH24DEI2_07620 [soil metagenome]
MNDRTESPPADTPADATLVLPQPVQDVLTVVKSILPDDLVPTLLLDTEEGLAMGDVAAFFTSTHAKGRLAAYVHSLIDAAPSPVRAVTLVVEAWLSVVEQPNDGAPRTPFVAPSQDPERREVVLVYFETPQGFETFTFLLENRQLGGRLKADGVHEMRWNFFSGTDHPLEPDGLTRVDTTPGSLDA